MRLRSRRFSPSRHALAADLRIVWEEGFYPEEDKAIGAVVAAYERETGNDVELTFYSQEEVTDKTLAALAAGDPPDLSLSLGGGSYLPQWALDDVLADLSDWSSRWRASFLRGCSATFGYPTTDRQIGLLCRADRAVWALHPCLEEPARPGGHRHRGHPPGIGLRSGRFGATR